MSDLSSNALTERVHRFDELKRYCSSWMLRIAAATASGELVALISIYDVL